MKKLLLILSVLYLANICASQAQETKTGFLFEEYNYISKNELFPTMFASMTHSFNTDRNISLWGFLLTSEKAKKGTFGVMYTPKITSGVLKLGLSCGIKGTAKTSGKASFLVKSFIFAKKGRFSLMNSLEYGDKTGYWYTGFLMVDVSNQLECGLRGQRFEGIGPMVQFKVKPFIFWINGAYDFEFKRYGALAGVNIKVKTPK